MNKYTILSVGTLFTHKFNVELNIMSFACFALKIQRVCNDFHTIPQPLIIDQLITIQYLDPHCGVHYWEWLAKQTESVVPLHFTPSAKKIIRTNDNFFTLVNFLFRRNKCFHFFETCRGTARKHVPPTLSIEIQLQNLPGRENHVWFGAFYKA